MKKDFGNVLGKRTLFMDGAMGSLLQGYGLKIGEYPESFNLSHREKVRKIHGDYVAAGSDIITLNTFGAYSFRYPNLEEMISAAVMAGREAISDMGSADRDVYMALDMGPTGKLLKPMGDLDFEDSYKIFRDSAVLAEKYGADLVVIETMSDTYEIKSAVLAVKENTDLPVICSLTFDMQGRTMTGCDFRTMAVLLEGLGVNAIGLNCGFGPDIFKEYIVRLSELTSLPVLIQPNAGLPQTIDGKAVYNLSPEAFAAAMLEIHKGGASILGGCCGTTPEHIKEMVTLVKSAGLGTVPVGNAMNPASMICSYSKCVDLNEFSPDNPITYEDIDDITEEAMNRIDDGAEIICLDLRTTVSEESLLPEAVKAVQELTNIPLCLISSNPQAIENALRIYNGKCALKIEDCTEADREKIKRSVKSYGAAIL